MIFLVPEKRPSLGPCWTIYTKMVGTGPSFPSVLPRYIVTPFQNGSILVALIDTAVPLNTLGLPCCALVRMSPWNWHTAASYSLFDGTTILLTTGTQKSTYMLLPKALWLFP